MLLESSINHAFASFNHVTAQFLAERLISFQDSVESRYLLAKALYLQQNLQLAKFNLDPTSFHFDTIYLYALICLDLNQFQEAFASISRILDNKQLVSASPKQWSSALHLLARINKRLNQIEQAKAAYRLALEADPLNFAAYVELCDLGGFDISISELLNAWDLKESCFLI